MDYDNSNTGVLFKNNKEGNDKKPDYEGSFTDENGKEWELAAWIRESKAGNKFMSLKASEKWVKEEKPAEKAAPAAFDDLSDLPF